MKQLLELAKERFAADWTDADERLFTQTALGKVAHFGDGDPAAADTWGKERVVPAGRIEWLCTDPEAIKAVTHRGVQILGARIESQLDLSYAKIEFPLSIKESAIPRGIVMMRCHLYALFLTGTHTGPMAADGLRVEHDLHMREGFHATGEVRLLGATIGGNLDCADGHFNKPNGDSLSADGIDVKGDVFLRDGFKAEGTVRLLGATIGGNFDCGKSHFSNSDRVALYADGIDVKGNVRLRNEFKSKGEVRLVGAMIAGDLDCQNGKFSKTSGWALEASRSKIDGSVYLRAKTLDDGCLDLDKKFRADGIVAFSGVTVGGSFQWRGAEDSSRCALHLESAKIGTLWDEEESWPAKLYLDGLVYDRLYSESPAASDARLRWLKRQGYDKGKFVPQPYVQLAKVLQEMGHEADARRILIAKQKDPARLAAMTIPQRVWHHVLGATIGYGYQPWQALLWIVGFIVLGAFLFQSGSDSTRFQKTIDGAPPAFNNIVYSLDAFVPLIDLHQAKYRLPKGSWLRVYLWLHIGFGWLLTTLLVVGLTGLVRK